MTPEELFEKILIETPIKGVARKARILELIRQFKEEWCKEQREFCADYVDDPVLYNSILNAPEPE